MIIFYSGLENFGTEPLHSYSLVKDVNDLQQTDKSHN